MRLPRPAAGGMLRFLLGTLPWLLESLVGMVAYSRYVARGMSIDCLSSGTHLTEWVLLLADDYAKRQPGPDFSYL
jgi:hypothetical protein